METISIKSFNNKVVLTLNLDTDQNNLIFYKFNSFTASVQKIIDKKLSFPYYTSVTWLDKFLLFNNCHFIPYILINYND